MDLVRNHTVTELELGPEQINETARFREDFDADSLDLYELVMELEDQYGITVSGTEAAKSRPLGTRLTLSLAKAVA